MKCRIRLAWAALRGHVTIIVATDYDVALVAPTYDHVADFIRDEAIESPTCSVHIYEGACA